MFKCNPKLTCRINQQGDIGRKNMMLCSLEEERRKKKKDAFSSNYRTKAKNFTKNKDPEIISSHENIKLNNFFLMPYIQQNIDLLKVRRAHRVKQNMR